MADSHTAFTGSVPDFYDRCLGPVLFEDYADDLARRVAAHAPLRVLETAAGTGILTRRIRDQLDAPARLTATDLNSPMLEVAQAKFASSESVTFTPADAAHLPFADESFDLVACQFGVMFYPDKPAAYREVRRVLAPRGRYLFNVWDSHRHNPFARVAYQTVARFFQADPPQFHQVPFAYHGIDLIKESLIEAGFVDLRVAILRIDKRVPDVNLFARGLIEGTPISDQIRARGVVRTQTVVDALTEALCDALGAAGHPLACRRSCSTPADRVRMTRGHRGAGRLSYLLPRSTGRAGY